MERRRKDLLGQMQSLSQEMERLFSNLFCPRAPRRAIADSRWRPLTDVYETPDAVVVRIELAGVRRDELDVSVENECLVIRGCRREIAPERAVSYHQMEINYGEFERVIHLRQDMRRCKIEAHFADGFLTVTISKHPPTEKKIDIKAV